MSFVLTIPFFVSFFMTLISTPYWIKRARMAELVGYDMHKLDRKPVAEIGGIPVLVGFLAGVLAYVGIATFYLHIDAENYRIFAILTTVLIAAMIGLVDDILGWKIGLRQWQKPLLTLFAALPLVVVNAGSSEIGVPFIGIVELSLVYPFLIVPLGIIGAANGFNMIGGYNGLEAGMGMVMVATLGLVSLLSGKSWLAMLAFSLLAAMAAFLAYNWYPSRVFPGNSFTYLTGAFLACLAIIGNSEKLALLLFLPYFLEFFLKLRGMMQRESFARLLPNGTLHLPYEKWYGIEHIAISLLQKTVGIVTEKAVVVTLLCMEAILGIIAFSIFYFRVGVF